MRTGTIPISDSRAMGTAVPAESEARIYSAPLTKEVVTRELEANSTPLEVWEGTVISVDQAAGEIKVVLDAKMGKMPRHTGEVDLEWVAEQDRDLVRPGAVFYLTLFKRSKPSVENAQELRFRRRPSWTAKQIKNIEAGAEALASKFKDLPIAE